MPGPVRAARPAAPPRRRRPASPDGPPEPAEPTEPLRDQDRTMLATDCGPAPMHLGAVLLLDGADDPASGVPEAFVARAAAVPRLTQVLTGRGRRSAWRRDPAADPARHLVARELAGGGERAVLDAAAELVGTPLDRSLPLWRAAWLTGWDGSGARRAALVVVLHHAVVDGTGGLGVLAALADPEDPTRPVGEAPVAPPPAAAARPPRGLRAWLHGLLELGLGTVPVVAARTSVNRPTGRARRLVALDVPLAAFKEGAHRDGGTVNDALVAAVVGALARLLADRGEQPRTLVVSVPVSGRPAGDRRAGNENGTLAVAVPTSLDRAARVRHVALATRRRKAGSRGHSALPLGALFRGLAAVRLFRPFIEHQRLVHTFETNVRGPERRLAVAGHEVGAVLPVAVNPGNVGVSFDVLSYAGRLTVTAVLDPLVVPDGDALTRYLTDELDAFVVARAEEPTRGPGRE